MPSDPVDGPFYGPPMWLTPAERKHIKEQRDAQLAELGKAFRAAMPTVDPERETLPPEPPVKLDVDDRIAYALERIANALERMVRR